MRKQVLAAVAALMIAAPAGATTAGMGAANDVAAYPTQERDDDFPWGLLGLLGLAGLLGLKRRDRDDDVRANRTGTGGTSNRM